jgi:hypothetical protein
MCCRGNLDRRGLAPDGWLLILVMFAIARFSVGLHLAALLFRSQTETRIRRGHLESRSVPEQLFHRYIICLGDVLQNLVQSFGYPLFNLIFNELGYLSLHSL